MKEISPTFLKLLKSCIQLESKYRSFLNGRLKNENRVNWKDIENIALSINEILSSYTQELPVKSVVNARRLASYVININDYELMKEEQEYDIIGHSNIGRKLDEFVREIENIYFETERKSIINALKFSFPTGILPDDVTEVINLTYQEALIDFENGCHFSAISICGKIIETVLSALYKEITGSDADEEKLGMDAIINRLKKSKGFEFKGMKDQLNIIKLHRNKAIHGSIMIPTLDESRGTISLTRDLLQKACSKNIKA